jgi:hypothetical protein
LRNQHCGVVQPKGAAQFGEQPRQRLGIRVDRLSANRASVSVSARARPICTVRRPNRSTRTLTTAATAKNMTSVTTSTAWWIRRLWIGSMKKKSAHCDAMTVAAAPGRAPPMMVTLTTASNRHNSAHDSPIEVRSDDNAAAIAPQYFANGTDLSVFPADYVGYVATQLNTRCNKTLGVKHWRKRQWQGGVKVCGGAVKEPLGPRADT